MFLSLAAYNPGLINRNQSSIASVLQTHDAAVQTYVVP